MAKDNNEEIIKILSEIRTKKEELSRFLYNDKQAMILAHYRMDTAISATTDKAAADSLQKDIATLQNNIEVGERRLAELDKEESGLMDELTGIEKGAVTMVENLNDRYPILFFPCRLETAFSPSATRQLWVRIFPEDITITTHEEQLTESEIDAGKAYWRAYVSSAEEVDRVNAWDILCRSFGAERAAWIARTTQPTNLPSNPGPDDLVFPTLTPKADSWTKQPYSDVMPDKYIIYCYGNDGSVITHEASIIPDVLKTGIDPTLNPDFMSFEQKTVSGRVNELTANEDVRWMVDFDAAIARGMGARIPLTVSQYNNGFKKILAIGVKASATLADSQQRLKRLIDNHHYTDGWSLVSQGSATNNTESIRSAYAPHEPGNATTHRTERTGPLWNPVYIQRQKTDGQLLCEALGLDYEPMQNIHNSNGTDINEAMHMGTALFHTAFGYTAHELMPVFGSRSRVNTELKTFFSDYVRSRGSLPAIRSGKMPYGILPTSVYSRLAWDSSPKATLLKSIWDFTNVLDVQWSSVLSNIETATAEKANSGHVRALADKLAPAAVSQSYVQRLGFGTGYIWNNLRYASIQYPQQANVWLQGQMGRINQTVNALPFLQPSHKAVQINYRDKQSNVSIPLVTGDNLADDSPLPLIGNVNILELIHHASFDQLRDEDYTAFGIQENMLDKVVRNSMLYILSRQAIMLEYFEVASILLNLSDDQRSDPEFVNIVESPQQVSGNPGAMGRLSFGRSRLNIMETPYNNYNSIGAYLSSGAANNLPEAASLVAAKSSLMALSTKSVGKLKLLTAELIDGASFRLDSWRLSLINERLNEIRGIRDGVTTRTMGSYIGSYSWALDVKRKATADTPVSLPVDVAPQFATGITKDSANKGYIHAPSLSQAVTGAVLMSAYGNRANIDMPQPLSVNISSRRTRAALGIMEIVRAGQSLGIALGYEFERKIWELSDNVQINNGLAKLRRAYPIENTVIDTGGDPEIIDRMMARHVVDGVKVVEVINSTGNSTVLGQSGLTSGTAAYEAVELALNWIADLMDAIGDISLSEGVFHMVQGNQNKSGAITEAVSKGKVISEVDVVKSVKTGLEVGQRFSMQFDTSAPLTLPNAWTTPSTNSAAMRAEPYVNKWLSRHLPAPTTIIVKVTAVGGTVHQLNMSQLSLSAADLMYLVPDDLDGTDASPFSAIIRRRARQLHGYNRATELIIDYDPVVTGTVSLTEVQGILIYAKRMVTACRPLNTHDYMLPADADITLRIYNVTELKNRLDTARTRMTTLRNALNTAVTTLPFNFNNVRNALFALSTFHIEMTVYEFVNDNTAEDEAALRSWAQTVLAITAERIAKSAVTLPVPTAGQDAQLYIEKSVEGIKTLFGNSFVVLPLFRIRTEEQAYLSTMVSGTSTLLSDVPDPDMLQEEWLSSISKVRENPQNYAIWRHLTTALNFQTSLTRRIIPMQLPYGTDGTERYLGTKVTTPAGLKEGRIAVGMSALNGYTVSADQAGIMIDEWTDVIPNREQTSGITFQQRQPNAKAPQALILGLTPRITGKWSWTDIVDMMNETLDLAKKRAIDYENIGKTPVGQLPGLIVPFAPGGNVIGLSPAHLLAHDES